MKQENDITQTKDNAHNTAYGLDRYSWQQGMNAQFDFAILENIEPSLVAKGGGSSLLSEMPWKLYQERVGALCATDHKWVQQEQVMQGKLVLTKSRNRQFTKKMTSP